MRHKYIARLEYTVEDEEEMRAYVDKYKTGNPNNVHFWELEESKGNIFKRHSSDSLRYHWTYIIEGKKREKKQRKTVASSKSRVTVHIPSSNFQKKIQDNREDPDDPIESSIQSIDLRENNDSQSVHSACLSNPAKLEENNEDLENPIETSFQYLNIGDNLEEQVVHSVSSSSHDRPNQSSDMRRNLREEKEKETYSQALAEFSGYSAPMGILLKTIYCSNIEYRERVPESNQYLPIFDFPDQTLPIDSRSTVSQVPCPVPIFRKSQYPTTGGVIKKKHQHKDRILTTDEIDQLFENLVFICCKANRLAKHKHLNITPEQVLEILRKNNGIVSQTINFFQYN